MVSIFQTNLNPSDDYDSWVFMASACERACVASVHCKRALQACVASVRCERALHACMSACMRACADHVKLTKINHE